MARCGPAVDAVVFWDRRLPRPPPTSTTRAALDLADEVDEEVAQDPLAHIDCRPNALPRQPTHNSSPRTRMLLTAHLVSKMPLGPPSSAVFLQNIAPGFVTTPG